MGMKLLIPLLFLFSFSLAEQLDGPDSVAVIRLRQINPESIKNDWEYGGIVVKCPDYSYTSFPSTDKKKSAISIGGLVRYGCEGIGIYHTHGASSIGYVDESFSELDTGGVQIRQYLITPNGNVQRFMPDTRKVQLLVDTGWVYIENIPESNWFMKMLKRNYRLDRK